MDVKTVKMRFIDSLCPPALLYVLFVAIQIALDVSLGMFVTAAIKFGMGVVVTVILDTLCGIQLGVVAWALVAAPFIVTSLATAISMGLDVDHRVVSGVREHFTEALDSAAAATPSNASTRNKKILGSVVMATPSGEDGPRISVYSE